MSLLLNGGRRTAFQLARRPNPWLSSRYASRISIQTPPPFPTIEACPNPSCPCAEMPSNLEIDRELPLNGTTPAYAEQVLISTGRADWKSKIEEEDDSVFLKQLKKYLGRGGKYSDPFHNVMLTNSSFPPTTSGNHPTPEDSTAKPGTNPAIDPKSDPPAPSAPPAPPAPPASAFLLPSFHYVPSIPLDNSSIETFLKAFVLPSRLHATHEALTREQKNILLRQPEMAKRFTGARKVDEIIILICGHGGRDQRCGILGPVLQAEFEDKLARQNIKVLKDMPVEQAVEPDDAVQEYVPTARVGLISHIGGHKFAGNVIVYVPPSFGGNALRGKGIWYGRVEPRHVEGIVEKTVLGGLVIKELLRGGVGQEGEVLRL